MGWFRRKLDPMTARARELDAEIGALKFQIHQLKNATNCSDPHQIQTVLEETQSMPTSPFIKDEEGLPESIPAEPERDCPGLYNDLGLRKFDLAGWWMRVKRAKPLPAPTKNEQLVTLATPPCAGTCAWPAIDSSCSCWCCWRFCGASLACSFRSSDDCPCAHQNGRVYRQIL